MEMLVFKTMPTTITVSLGLRMLSQIAIMILLLRSS